MMKYTLLLPMLISFAGITHAQGQPAKTELPPPTDAQFPKAGEWPSFRRNGTLQAHSPLKGKITKPTVAWKQFVGAMESLVVIETSDKSTKLSLPGEETKSRKAADSIIMADFIPVPKNEEEDNSSRNYTYADVLPEYPGKEKLEFESAFHKTMINGEWALCVGRCMAKKNGEWIQIWETKPFAYLFEALPLVGDFDNNNTQEIAILPFWQMLLIDAKTGIVKDSCRFNDNRSYGFAGVYDFDRDGKSEFLIQADFSKHVDVLGFKDGKLSLLWQQDIEQDVAHPQKILRVAPDPVMDIDNDGQPEVITTLFNDSGDARWHLTFRDALTGAVKADFPDELLAARLDLDGDGVYEFLTTCSRGVSTLMKIRARSVKESQPKIIWEKENAEWQSWDIQLPRHVKSLATGGQRTVLSRSDEKGTYVVIREPGSATRMNLAVARWDGSTFKSITTVTGENLEGLGFDATGRILIRSRHRFGQQSSLDIVGGKSTRQTTRTIGSPPSAAVVAWPNEAKVPTIVVQGATEEQVTFQPPAKNGAKVPLNYISGRGQGSWWPNTFGPVIVDLAGDGRRQLLVADAGPSGAARISAKDLDGRVLWQHEFPLIAGTPPPQNTGGVILWQTGHFTDRVRQDVIVTTQRSKGGSEETYLLSGSDGHQLWHRYKQISKRGVGGNFGFGILDYDDDGLDDLASLWPSIIYFMRGSTGEDFSAMDTRWKQVYAKQVYFGQPVVGNFMNDGKPALYFSGTLMTGVIRKDATLVWFDALDKSPAYFPSFGDFDGDGRTDAIGVGYEDGIRCYDTETGKVKWHMPTPGKSFESFGQREENPVKGSASADLDGDGRDEALVVLDKTLFCLGSSRDGSAGEIRWQVSFPEQVGPPTVVSLDKNGSVSILVISIDGFVYCVK